MSTMSSDFDDIWYEFFDLMMSSYKMEMRTPKFFKKNELNKFTSPLLIIASNEDIFFPAKAVFPKADRIFSGKVNKMEISGKHLPSINTMSNVCKAIIDFDD